MNEIVERCRKAGIRLWVEGNTLRYDAPKGTVTPDLLAEFKANKATVMAELSRDWSAMSTAALLRVARGAGMRIRVADTGDGRRVQYDVESGGPAGLWDEIRRRKDEILAAVPEEVDMARLSEKDLDDMERPVLPGVSSEFAARLSAEDLEDIAAGDIPLQTVQAFEQTAITREVEDLKELFEERCTILEHDAGLPRAEADLEAARIMSTYARNRGYLWASLRAALADYPLLLSQVPDRPGNVDGLPLWGWPRSMSARTATCSSRGSFPGRRR